VISQWLVVTHIKYPVYWMTTWQEA